MCLRIEEQGNRIVPVNILRKIGVISISLIRIEYQQIFIGKNKCKSSDFDKIIFGKKKDFKRKRKHFIDLIIKKMTKQDNNRNR